MSVPARREQAAYPMRRDVDTASGSPAAGAAAGTPTPGGGAVHPINNRMRDGISNETLLTSLAQTLIVLKQWRHDDSAERLCTARSAT